MARVIFINRFYWPEEPATAQLLTDLAEGLAARGHAAMVITSQPAGGGPRDETRAGVHVWRVRATRWGARSLAGRAVDFATFLAGSAWRLLCTAQAGDIVVAMTDPPLLGVVLWPAACLRRARYIHWVQDVFPEVALTFAPSALERSLGAGLRAVRNFVWRHCTACVAVGADIAALITRSGTSIERIVTIANWAPVGLEPQPLDAAAGLREAWGLKGKFLIVYSGNLGRVHDLAPVLDVAFALRDEPRVAFVFIGAGAQRDALENAARGRGLVNVHFHPPQPRAQLAQSLALGDVHLVTLRPGCEELVFPSKLYGIAAVGRPVVYIGPRRSEVARVVEHAGFGLAFTRDEVPAAANALHALATDPDRCAALGTKAAEFARTAGRFDLALNSWEELLQREAAC